MDLFCFIECAKQSRSPEVLFDLLVSCSSEQGFSQVAYGAVVRYDDAVGAVSMGSTRSQDQL